MFSWAMGRISIGTQKQIQMSHGKQAISVWIIVVPLYI